MTEQKTLNQVWLKAAVLGSLWAASEIVLGSFLHNLKIPFRSNILTAIGIILLISVAYHWKEKGLFWRSGLICALMKAISPSAVIFGPMIAIFSEALLMEISVRIFRRTVFGFLLAGVLAMSWNFIQFILNYILVYGFKIVDLYVNSLNLVEKQFHLNATNPMSLLLILILIYVVMGITAAFVGMYIGRRANKMHIPQKSLSVNEVQKMKQVQTLSSFPFSLTWLFINFLFLLTVFILIGFTSWKVWIVAGFVVITVWYFRYTRNFKRLSKPAFWLSLIFISLLSAWVYYQANQTTHALAQGLLAGLEMDIRAIILVLGFSVIGTELRNPKIINFLSNTSFRNSQIAIELAFATLPDILSAMPSVKTFFRKPILKMYEMISYIDFWLEKAEFRMISKENVIIITGMEKTGKSTVLMEMVELLHRYNIVTGGFVSPAVYENNIHVGYDLQDLQTNQRVILSRTYGDLSMPKVGNYYFYKDGLSLGKKLLEIETVKNADVVVIDEIGPWELKYQGWAKSVNALVKEYYKPMIWVVRESLVAQVIEYYSLKNPCVIHIKEEDKFQKMLDILR